MGFLDLHFLAVRNVSNLLNIKDKSMHLRQSNTHKVFFCAGFSFNTISFRCFYSLVLTESGRHILVPGKVI